MRPHRRRFGAVTDAQFVKNAGHVHRDSPVTDEKGPRDLPVAVPPDQEGQDVRFAAGEVEAGPGRGGSSRRGGI